MAENQIEIISSDNELSSLVDAACNFAKASKSDNTRRTYSIAWRSFTDWCKRHGADYQTSKNKEELIALYATSMIGVVKINSLNVYLAGICAGYLSIGVAINLRNPRLHEVLSGIRKTYPKRPERKTPILTDDLRAMIDAISVDKGGRPSLIGIRDRALLLLGFTGAFRRSELVDLCVSDITFTVDGFKALLRHSKTDQEGEGKTKAFPYGINHETCPVLALRSWLDLSCITEGPIFRAINKHGHISQNAMTGHSVSRIIKRNPFLTGREKAYSGHSLRAGFCTQCAMAGVPLDQIMAQTGHTKVETTQGYIRRAESVRNSAAARLGL